MASLARTLRRAQPRLGTYVEVEAAAPADEAGAAIEAAFAGIARVEAEMSFHDPASALSRLNREAWAGPQPVSPWLERVLRAAQALHRDSGGTFDPSVAGHLVAAGLLPPPVGPVPDPAARFDDVVIEPGRVRFRRRLWLDLGGIAKGFAVDVAVLTLRRLGIRTGLVNAGGDLRVFGPEPRTIHRRAADDPGRLEPIGQLASGACATSAGTVSAEGAAPWPVFRAGGARLTRDGSVTVIAPRCLLADGLTKIAALMPAHEAAPILNRYGARRVAS